MPSIFLRTDTVTHGSDESGLIIKGRTFPLYHSGPYTTELLPHDKKTLSILDYVAPLEYYCIRSLFFNVDQLDLGEAPRVMYSGSDSQLRLMKTLIPCFEHDMQSCLMKYVDPRLWATLTQVMTNLPCAFRIYTLPLSDTHLSLLQNVKSSPDFTFITVVDMSRRMELNDETIGELKPLINLCVLDISGTEVTTWGIKKLSMCLTRDEAGGMTFGPWKLRIWSMMNCIGIKEDVKSILPSFPLLSVVDLRGTSVTGHLSFSNFTSSPASNLHPCYYPYPTISWIDALCKMYPQDLFACRTEMPYILHVRELEYSRAPPRPQHLDSWTNPPKTVDEDDRFLVLSPSVKKYSSRNLEALGLTLRRMLEDSDLYSPSDDGENRDEYEYEDGDEESDFQQRLWFYFANRTAEQLEVRDFYTPAPPRTTTPTKENNKDFPRQDLTSKSRPPNDHPPIINKKQLQCMFFRIPLSFQSVDHPKPGPGPGKKRRIGDDEQLVKKRNDKSLTKTFMEKMMSGIKHHDTELENEKKTPRSNAGSKMPGQGRDGVGSEDKRPKILHQYGLQSTTGRISKYETQLDKDQNNEARLCWG
ncbi:hypothetical protein Clacol_000020 [Clathrus columnatus]|uniref:Uncharacterized protein n=1 Tax=Clathrus columnatus TaxID=1419009 RepID=A0AAV4ZZL9_9AGAM|nr:hypothetical protein Clacol_000020 [Clathrus columnatus]